MGRCQTDFAIKKPAQLNTGFDIIQSQHTSFTRGGYPSIGISRSFISFTLLICLTASVVLIGLPPKTLAVIKKISFLWSNFGQDSASFVCVDYIEHTCGNSLVLYTMNPLLDSPHIYPIKRINNSRRMKNTVDIKFVLRELKNRNQ